MPIFSFIKKIIDFIRLGCLGIIIGLFLALIFALIYGLAASGIYKIPLLSSLVYREPEPVKVVSLTKKSSLEDKFSSLLNIKEKQINLPINEEELTALINKDQRLKKSQIAITKEEMELYAISRIKNSQDLYFKVSFIPQVEKEKIDLLIKKMQIGSLVIPKILANLTKEIIWYYWQAQLTIISEMKVQKVLLDDGFLTITGQPDWSKIKLNK